MIEGGQVNFHAVLEMFSSGQLRFLAACRTYGVDSENRPQRGQFLPDLQAHSPAMGQNEVSVKTNLYSSYVGTKKMVRAKCGEAKNGPLRSICSRRSLSPTGC